ncbi:MAG TPA: hypothetical protein VFD82_23150 [Planctomycetota bacterium]|nr:hypothetical protein [Planctomycetota bacterium]
MIQTLSTQRPNPERGAALVVAVFFSIIVVGLTLAGAVSLNSHRMKTKVNWVVQTQAVQAARSGLAEGLTWLRRQTAQPVTVFSPVLNPSVEPPVLDTIDPEVGLVREFEVTETIWARYELWKDWAADPDPVRRAKRVQFQCEDISQPRAGGSPGTVWRLRSLGYVYHLVDPTVPFNQRPNQIIASQLMETDVRRVVVTLPGLAALCVGDGNSCHINTGGRVYGMNGYGILYPAGTGTPTTGGGSTQRVSGGLGAMNPVSVWRDGYEDVFGMSLTELTGLAHMVVTDLNDFPVPIPSMSLVIVDVGTTVNLDSSHPLLGTGIVIVRGHLVLSQGSNSNFSGLLYVEGNLTMRDPSEINGAVVVTGDVTIQGSNDFSTIRYDQSIIDAMMGSFGNYQRSKPLHLPRRDK